MNKTTILPISTLRHMITESIQKISIDNETIYITQMGVPRAKIVSLTEEDKKIAYTLIDNRKENDLRLRNTKEKI